MLIKKKSLILTLPLWVMLPRKTKADVKFRLNLNIYRNTNFIVLNQAKQIFHSIVKQKLQEMGEVIPMTAPIRLTFLIWTQRKCDLANVVSVVEKFVADAIVACQVITDDNCEVIAEGGYKFGGYDRANPRVDVKIEEI